MPEESADDAITDGEVTRLALLAITLARAWGILLVPPGKGLTIANWAFRLGEPINAPGVVVVSDDPTEALKVDSCSFDFTGTARFEDFYVPFITWLQGEIDTAA